MQIPPWPSAGEREAELLRMVLESPQWGGFHPFVAEFEQSFAAYQHARFGISAMNGSVTLELALEVLGIGPGDEVIVPAISFITTATAVSRSGATPVFVDIEADSYNIDSRRVREAITPQTKAVIPVHFGGVLCDMEALLELCREHNLVLLEDAAHAHGSEYEGKRAGSFGLVASFSFQNGKVLSAGEGGMLVTSDESLAARARSIANCGRLPGRGYSEHHELGTNFRLSGIHAAVLLAQFEKLPEEIRQREDNLCVFNRLTADVKEIVWQRRLAGQTQNSNYLVTGRLVGSARDEFCRSLLAAGIPVTPFYPHTLYGNPIYAREKCRVMPCPVAETRIHDSFWIGHRAFLAPEETIHEIAQQVRAAVTSSRVSIPS
ncbi:MAG TPA: DegT/DnrJ/EryC1/StrS family aminotransferase [Bryobacteraceae bacterium]